MAPNRNRNISTVIGTLLEDMVSTDLSIATKFSFFKCEDDVVVEKVVHLPNVIPVPVTKKRSVVTKKRSVAAYVANETQKGDFLVHRPEMIGVDFIIRCNNKHHLIQCTTQDLSAHSVFWNQGLDVDFACYELTHESLTVDRAKDWALAGNKFGGAFREGKVGVIIPQYQ